LYLQTSLSRQKWPTAAPVTDRTGGCTDSEKIYTSTLTLSRYTQFTDNTDTSVKFQCGAISVIGNQSYTQTSVNVRFAGTFSVVFLTNNKANMLHSAKLSLYTNNTFWSDGGFSTAWDSGVDIFCLFITYALFQTRSLIISMSICRIYRQARISIRKKYKFKILRKYSI
jgi:hypothetical protein